MAPLASAQLVSAITVNQLTFGIQNVITPTGAVGFPSVGVFTTPQLPVIIDQEVMYCVLQQPSGTLIVRSRGAEGSAAQPHDALANVYIGGATDMGTPAIGTSGFFDPNLPYVLSIGTSPFVIVMPPLVPGNVTYNINTASAVAITLPAPLLSMNGTTYTFTSNTAFAHVITATNLIQSGVGGQPKTTVTFNAIQGAGLILTAENGLWNIPAPSPTVTIS